MNSDGSFSASSIARRTAPFEPSSPGDSTISAPYRRRSRRRSAVTFAGTTQVRGYPRSRAASARAMPVFPLVGSRSRRPGSSSPDASAASSIALATRSLIEPLGFCPSSLAYSRTPDLGESRGSSTSGVDPTRSSSDAAVVLASTGHGRKQDELITVSDRGLEPVARAHVLTAEIDVHERGELAVLQQLTC